jgi:hypothetical protein
MYVRKIGVSMCFPTRQTFFLCFFVSPPGFQALEKSGAQVSWRANIWGTHPTPRRCGDDFLRIFWGLEPLNSLVGKWKQSWNDCVDENDVFFNKSLIQFEIVCLVRMVFRPSKHTCSILVLGDTLRTAFSHVAAGIKHVGFIPPIKYRYGYGSIHIYIHYF